jgi:hypothetical protein
MATLGYYLLLAAFVVAAYAAAISVAGARRRSQRLIESGLGAFYLITAIMTVASAVIIYSVRRRRLLDQVRAALFGLDAAVLLQDHLVLGRPGRLDHVLGLPAVDRWRGRGPRQP